MFVLNILPTYSKQGAQPGSSIAVILSLRESKHSAADAKGLCYSCDFPEQIFFFFYTGTQILLLKTEGESQDINVVTAHGATVANNGRQAE